MCILFFCIVWFCLWRFSFSTLIRCLGLLTCKNQRPYNLYCVGGDIKHCTIQSNPVELLLLAGSLECMCCDSEVMNECLYRRKFLRIPNVYIRYEWMLWVCFRNHQWMTCYVTMRFNAVLMMSMNRCRQNTTVCTVSYLLTYLGDNLPLRLPDVLICALFWVQLTSCVSGAMFVSQLPRFRRSSVSWWGQRSTDAWPLDGHRLASPLSCQSL